MSLRSTTYKDELIPIIRNQFWLFQRKYVLVMVLWRWKKIQFVQFIYYCVHPLGRFGSPSPGESNKEKKTEEVKKTVD